MIISFARRFIFVAIPKTATHSLRVALRPHLGVHDWEQCGLFEEKYFPVAPLAAIGHGHLSYQQIRPFLLPGFWENSFSFCTVRNPYHRFVSYCHFMNRDNQRMQNDPLGTMKTIMQDKQATQQILFRPQHEFVTDEAGKLMVSFVAKLEMLPAHFAQICQRLQIPTVALQYLNGSGSENFRSYYDRELQEMVHEFYRQDFALFDYATEFAPSRSKQQQGIAA